MEIGVPARRQTVVLLFITLGLIAISCSDHESPTSPRTSMAGNATISGTLLAGGEPLANATVRVAPSGQSAQTDAAGRFTLADVAPGTVSLEIHGAGIASTATVSAAPGVVTRVTVTVQRGRSTTTLGPRSDGTEGTILNINAPNFMLQRQGGTTLVRTDGGTKFRSRGNLATFADLKAGQRVEVEGAAQPDGSVLAVTVTIENPEEEATRTPPPTVTGTPPTATATRTPKPEDDDGTKSPTVTGTRTPKPDDDDNRTRTPTATGTPPTVTPTKTPNPEDQDREFDGRVGTIMGASFVLMTESGAVTVQTSAATQFRRDGDPASLADVKTGGEVEVRGQVQPDNSVLASQVDIKGD